jgi:Protein of unknown function (DUF3108).
MKLKLTAGILIAGCIILFFGFMPERSSVYEDRFSSDKDLEVGEELTYLVSYSFLDLGELRFKVLEKTEVNGKHFYKTICYINSYSSVPFVSLHQIYESKLNNEFFSDFFRGLVKDKEYTTYTEYYFDYKSGKLKVRKGKVKPPEVWTDSVTTVDKQYQDGLSIFYYARMNTGQNKTVLLPCFVNEKKVKTTINFHKNVSAVSCPAVKYDIACNSLDGVTDFVSVFGLTGRFEGWFTNDKAAIPIVASMKVIIGNVTVKLKQYKRNGWNPPKFN